MINYEDHNAVIEAFNDDMDVEKYNREMASEAVRFVHGRNGQWEDDVFSATGDKKPRYTFDQASPVVNQIAGEIEQADFGIKVAPTGGEATEDLAKLYDGMIRNIQNVSEATKIYNAAGRKMVTSGIGGWRVKHDFVDADSFDMDLMITPLLDFGCRVWFDRTAKEQDKSDAKHCHVIQPMSLSDYNDKFPDGSESSVGLSICSTQNNVDFGYNADDIFIGQIYYKKEVKRTLVLMTDGSVREDNDDFKKIEDELAEKGITVDVDDNGERRERKRNKIVVMSRLFDANDWLIEPEETVFSHVPVVPVYGNYDIEQNVTYYYGAVEKMMDPQRVMNYSLSREIEEGALAPRAKWWMTLKQMAGFEKTLATLNTNADPVQGYNHDPEAPGAPQQSGGAQINQGLRVLSESMSMMITKVAGLFSANMGDNPGLQSGVAIKSLQDKGDTGTVKYFSSLEVGICHTGKILVGAIPIVYDTKRQVRITQEDGTAEMTVVNDKIFDEETNAFVPSNDLSIGKYDVTCSAGPSFQNRQQEAVTGILEASQVNPAIMEVGGDILTRNMSFPGAEQISERLRAQLFDAGMIPVEQMTDEEKQELLAAQQARAAQGDQPSPEAMIGQAELIKAQNEQDKTQVSVQKGNADIQIAINRERREDAKAQASARNDNAKLVQNQQQFDMTALMTAQQQTLDQQQAIIQSVKTMAESLKLIQEAAAGPVVGPGFIDNVRDQSDLLGEAQDVAEGL